MAEQSKNKGDANDMTKKDFAEHEKTMVDVDKVLMESNSQLLEVYKEQRERAEHDVASLKEIYLLIYDEIFAGRMMDRELKQIYANIAKNAAIIADTDAHFAKQAISCDESSTEDFNGDSLTENLQILSKQFMEIEAILAVECEDRA